MAVAYETADGTATAGNDDVSTSGTATIPAGNRAASIFVGLVDDGLYESDERFELRLSDVTNGVLDTDVVSITIQGNGEDALPGDVTAGCAHSSDDLALLVRVLTDPGFVSPGNPGCDVSGSPEPADVTCLCDTVFAGS